MVQKLTVHSPRIHVVKGNRLFDLRTGHTKIRKLDDPGPESLPVVCAKLASGQEFNHCSVRVEFSQWTQPAMA
jgi:hypothetical protein